MKNIVGVLFPYFSNIAPCRK